MFPKVVAAMVSVSLNASKTNAMEEFVSQFINICETSPIETLLMDVERLIIRSKAVFAAAETAERSIVSRRQVTSNRNRSNMANEFDLERAEAIVRGYITGSVNRTPWRCRAGNVEMTEKLRVGLNVNETRHGSLFMLPGHLYRFCRTPKELVSALRRILQWVVPSANAPISLDDKGGPIAKAAIVEAVRSFYATETFGNMGNLIREGVMQASDQRETTCLL